MAAGYSFFSMGIPRGWGVGPSISLTIKETTYWWPHSGTDKPLDLEKTTFYTKAGDQICGVGYYKELLAGHLCPFMAQSRHAQCAGECRLWGRSGQ
jgi:hypothetical protein